MENIKMPNFCIKCNNDLNDKEKAVGIPICQNCIESLVVTIGNRVSDIEIKRVDKQIGNFSRFILSSGHLMGLDDVAISQCCFNVFMSSVVDIENRDIILSEKIFKQAIEFVDKELENIKLKKCVRENPNDQLRLFMEELIKKGSKNNGGEDDKKGDNIIESKNEKVIDEKAVGKEKKGRRVDME